MKKCALCNKPKAESELIGRYCGWCDHIYGEVMMDLHAEFVVDMWEAKTMNSSMASVIVHIIRHVKKSERPVCAVNVSTSVLNALESLHLTDLLTVYETALDFEIEKGVEIQSISH